MTRGGNKMASETIKALLMIAPFGLLGSALCLLRMRTQDYAVVPVRVRRRSR
jgi:hypothetical protein